MTLRVATRAAPVPRAVLIVAALTAAALLSGYVQVLYGAVRTGELRRVASADHARSVQRCNVLPLDASRKHCLSQLGAPLREVLQ